VLVPTPLETRILDERGMGGPGLALRAICGFGPVAAAARTAELLALLKPSRVVLVGIAGTYDAARLAIGSATRFGRVAIDGIGAGTGANRLGASELGFPQWDGPGRTIFDSLELPGCRPCAWSEDASSPMLLTVCAASTSAQEAGSRRERYAGAAAEDMEGFAVALACSLAGIPLHIVRGISNRAGDRRRERWEVARALDAAAALAVEILRSEDREARA
jgi:futalosine hydrolase